MVYHDDVRCMSPNGLYAANTMLMYAANTTSPLFLETWRLSNHPTGSSDCRRQRHHFVGRWFARRRDGRRHWLFVHVVFSECDSVASLMMFSACSSLRCDLVLRNLVPFGVCTMYERGSVLVLPSNSWRVTHPNNTLAQYITKSHKSLWWLGIRPHRDTLSARLVHHSKRRLTVEHDGTMETDAHFAHGYYHSPKALATTHNGDKPGRVKFSCEPVTQKFIAHMKSETKFTLYGDLPDILGFGVGSGDSNTSLTSSAGSMFVRAYSFVDLMRGFESQYVYSSIVEPRIVGDKIAQLLRIMPIPGKHREMMTARFDHVQYIPVLSLEFGSVETEIRDGTDQRSLTDRPVHSNAGRWQWRFTFDGAAPGYSDELWRLICEAGGWGTALYFTAARVQRGHGFGSLFSGLLRSVAPLIRRCAVALEKRALTTGRRLLAMSWLVRTTRRRQNEGHQLSEEIWCKASSTQQHIPVNEWSV